MTVRQVMTETNDPVFPDESLVKPLKSRLAKRSGISVATNLKEQEARLTTSSAPAPEQLR
jgi:hypothetical protein